MDRLAGFGITRMQMNDRAPASAAAMASSAICCGVMGRCGDMVGVWIPPVTAQVMITFLAGNSFSLKLHLLDLGCQPAIKHPELA